MVSETQMIALLSSGVANDDVFIIRELAMSYKGESG
jgi:hypothetical protein